MFNNGHWYKSSGKMFSQKCHFQKEMSSWGGGFVQKKGHMILPYYHSVAFGNYADEFFKLIRSIYYAQQTNEFLFVFDKLNSITHTIGLFEFTLKKNNYVRFLPYFPSQGFDISNRKDILEQAFQKPPSPEKLLFFPLFASVFDLQNKIKEQITKVYARKEISLFDGNRLGICLHNGQTDFQSLLNKISPFAKRPIDPVSLFVSSSSREQYKEFREKCPPHWLLVSMWETIPPTLLTEEQQLETLYSFLGAVVCLSDSVHLFGSFQDPVFRFMYCKEAKFRTPSNRTVMDGSSFSYF